MRIPVLAWALLWGMGAVYAAFLALDLFWPGAVTAICVLKYAGMVLCMALAVVGSRRPWQKRDARLVLVALSFTLAADFILLFTPYFVPGVFVFCAAHLTYLYRYCRWAFAPAAALVGGVLAVAAVRVLPGAGLPTLYLAGGLYALLILCVTATAFASALPRPNRRLAAAGMVLFLLCDVNVLAFNMLPATAGLYSAARVLMWLFYLPAQALLALSCYDLNAVNTQP